MSDYCIIFTTTDSLELAQKIAKSLVLAKLAACVNIDEIQSIFSWEDKLQNRSELRLMIKALSNNYNKIEKQILALHNDQVPEIIKIDFNQGLKSYLNWMDAAR